ICGNALEVVPTLKQTYDLIVNDIDKEGYPLILPRLVERLRTGGMLVTDNVLRQGKVTGPASDPATAAVQEYNRLLAEADNLWNSFIPLRDGVGLSVKLRKKDKG
ncbi:MAG: methyltransferase, partial [Calditrichaeota bacterium]|nr:methyltransferase [Calditrichota bacterium]